MKRPGGQDGDAPYGWAVFDRLDDDGTLRVIARATPRQWADLFQAAPELAGALQELADLLDQDAA